MCQPLNRGCEKTSVMVGSWGGRLALKLGEMVRSHKFHCPVPGHLGLQDEMLARRRKMS
jgi:hypothetical protein